MNRAGKKSNRRWVIALGRLFVEEDHQKRGKRGVIGQSAYVAHLGSKDDFLPEFDQALLQTSSRELVIVGDGAAWIWEWAEHQHPDAVQILDYFHAKQALNRYAKAHFTSKKRRRAWLDRQEERLFDDAVEQLLDEVARAGYRSLSDLEERERLLVYLKHNKDRMRYGSYRAQGMMIGSGPIESAHRNVIQQRLKLAGQRWSQSGAQAVLNVLRKSQHWGALIKQTCRLKMAA